MNTFSEMEEKDSHCHAEDVYTWIIHKLNLTDKLFFPLVFLFLFIHSFISPSKVRTLNIFCRELLGPGRQNDHFFNSGRVRAGTGAFRAGPGRRESKNFGKLPIKDFLDLQKQFHSQHFPENT